MAGTLGMDYRTTGKGNTDQEKNQIPGNMRKILVYLRQYYYQSLTLYKLLDLGKGLQQKIYMK